MTGGREIGLATVVGDGDTVTWITDTNTDWP